MNSSKFPVRVLALLSALIISAAFAGCSGDNNTSGGVPEKKTESTASVQTGSEESSVSSKNDADFSRTMGSWILTGGNGFANIVMNGMGQFAAYDENNSIKAKGYLEYPVESNADRYDLYSDDGTLIDSIYFDSDSRFHIGGDASAYYEIYVGSSGVSSTISSTGNSSSK